MEHKKDMEESKKNGKKTSFKKVNYGASNPMVVEGLSRSTTIYEIGYITHVADLAYLSWQIKLQSLISPLFPIQGIDV